MGFVMMVEEDASIIRLPRPPTLTKWLSGCDVGALPRIELCEVDIRGRGSIGHYCDIHDIVLVRQGFDLFGQVV